MGKFVDSLSGEFAKDWLLRVLSPAFVFWTVGALAVTGTGPNAGGGTRWWVAASYADDTLMTSASLPGPDQNIMLIGMGCSSFDSTLPVT